MRTVGGIPILGWAAALGLGIVGFVWMKKKSASSSASPATKAGQPTAFTQAQEVQDFQVFSALTSAQQGSDLNFLTEVAGLFSGGSSPTGATGGATGGGGGTTTPVAPAPPSTGTAPPATAPVSSAPAASAPAAPTAAAATPPQDEPGYAANIGQLLALNPGLASNPTIQDYPVSYNGVPL